IYHTLDIYTKNKMALTIFLFKVSNIDDPTIKMNNIDEDDDQATSDITTVKFVPEEDIPLLCAKIKFRGIY
ncbi:unnamed protein product, partial [Rotaria magnacalcarata]